VVVLGIFSVLLLASAVICAFAASWNDLRLQRFRVRHKPRSAYLFVPLRWIDPALYTPDGDKYRRRAIALTFAIFVCGGLAMITLLFGW